MVTEHTTNDSVPASDLRQIDFLVPAGKEKYLILIYELMASPSSDKFVLKSRTQAEEDAYDLMQNVPPKNTGNLGTVAHLVKGALGAGILGGHQAFQLGGLIPASTLQVSFGLYMTYCVYILVRSTQIIYKRLQTYNLTYSDIGEAALAMCPNKKLAKFHKVFRYSIDIALCLDQFGACVCYQLIISKTIKQFVENDPNADVAGIPGYPDLRIYLVIMLIPCIMICLITNLKYLAPFSLAADGCILAVILTTIYYSVENHPSFEGMTQYGDFDGIFRCLAMSVFSMSFTGCVIPVYNRMGNPNKYGFTIGSGMGIIILFLFTISFFGMNAYREKSTTPITLNFPIANFPKILKGLMGFMIYVTHGLNFFAPFHLCWHYLKKKHAKHFDNPSKMLKLEKIYRALLCCCIAAVAILFPAADVVMGFTGAFCLSNYACIFPNMIEIFVIWTRPGFGRFHWRLWKSIIMIFIGTILLTVGTYVNFAAMIDTFRETYK